MHLELQISKMKIYVTIADISQQQAIAAKRSTADLWYSAKEYKTTIKFKRTIPTENINVKIVYLFGKVLENSEKSLYIFLGSSVSFER